MGDNSDTGHPGLLALCCRICGRRNVKAPTPHIEKNNGVHFDREPDYRSFLSRLHEVSYIVFGASNASHVVLEDLFFVG